jgi:hypothetical protein
MTSRRSPPRRSSGSSLTAKPPSPQALAPAFPRSFLLTSLLTCLLALCPPDAAAARDADPLVATNGGVTVDWQAGTLAATGGAAGDLRMPSVELARPGAERRARAVAEAKLRVALMALPLGGGQTLKAAEIDRALARARAVDTQYQSNGGAVVRLQVRFGDWLDPKAPSAEAKGEGEGGASVATLAVHSMRLAAAPIAKVGGREVRLGAATYRLGPAPADASAFAAKSEHGDRLVLAAGGDLAARLARGVVLIYVQKVVK